MPNSVFLPIVQGGQQGPLGSSWPAAQDSIARELARRQAEQAAQQAQALQQQYQPQQGQFPGHPPNAASVSSDYLKSYDQYGRELDSNGNVAIGSWGNGGGSGGAGGAPGATPHKWGSSTGAPTPWWLPGLGGVPGNPWGAMMQMMMGGAQPQQPAPSGLGDNGMPPVDPQVGQPVGPGIGTPPPGLPPGIDPRAVAADPAGYQQWLRDAQQQSAGMMGQAGTAGTPGMAGATGMPGMTGMAGTPGTTGTPGTPIPGYPGMPNWAQPNYNESPFQNLNDDQWRRNLEAAAGLYFPMMNYMQGADQFNQTLAEQKQGNRWSEGFQDRTWDAEFGEGTRRYNQDFGESSRRYGLDFGESSRRFNTELDQRKREAAWQKTADAYNITGRAVLPRARFVSYR